MTKFVELSHRVENGMKAYPGFPNPKIGAFLSREDSRAKYAGKAEFYIGRVEMVGNVGTYLDAPFHRHANGADLSMLPLRSIAGLDGVVLEGKSESGRAVSLECGQCELRDRAVLIKTGWDGRWGRDDYWALGPYLSDGSIDLLIHAGAALVGVDFWNIDDVENFSRPAHTRLLTANIPIVEHMTNLASLPRVGFKFYAVPPPIVNGASFPVRAFAEIDE